MSTGTSSRIAENVSFVYDDLYRLKNVNSAVSGVPQSFTYNGIGNILTNGAESYSYTPA